MKPLKILYCDNHLLALDKPAGLLTQDSGTGRENLEDQAKVWIKEAKNKPGAVFLNAVHRIDRVVSGVVLFASTSKALTRLNADIRAKSCQKTYRALVESKPAVPAKTLENYLAHRDHRAVLCKKNAPDAKLARLHYKTIKPQGENWLLEIELETGRYHQIRAQLAAIGCPILGDKKYGAKRSFDGRIALHHYRLKIKHPTLKEDLTFTADCPF